jgi:hypothetical protein
MARIEEWDHIALEHIFTRAWRPVSIDNLIISYSPFPDCNLALSLYSANAILKQPYGYVSGGIERRGSVPAHLFFSMKGKPCVDYWCLYRPEDIRGLCWHVMMSTPRVSDEFGNWIRDMPGPRTYTNFISYVQAWDVTAQISGVPGLLWPAQYWLHIDDQTTSVQYVPWQTNAVYGVRRDGSKSMADFKRPWMRNVEMNRQLHGRQQIPTPWRAE